MITSEHGKKKINIVSTPQSHLDMEQQQKKMNTVQTSEMTKHLSILAQMTAASLE